MSRDEVLVLRAIPDAPLEVRTALANSGHVDPPGSVYRALYAELAARAVPPPRPVHPPIRQKRAKP